MEARPRVLSRRELRQQLRRRPRDRRKDIGRAIRQGRAVNDPRDAALAAALAERLDKRRRLWPWWIMPRSRPTGWRAWAWIVHLGWMVGGVVYALVVISPGVWSALPGVWRWLLVGVLAYGAISTPVTIAWMLRIYWHAAEAARKNRELLAHNS
jgi:hypothetical protein